MKIQDVDISPAAADSRHPCKSAILNFVREIQDNESVLDFISAVVDAADVLVKKSQAEERERCAKIADEFTGGFCGRFGASLPCALDIAAKIRSGK